MGTQQRFARRSHANMVSKNKGNWEESRFHAQFGGEKKHKIAPFQETLNEAAIAKLNGLNGDLKRIEDRLVRQGSESKVEIFS